MARNLVGFNLEVAGSKQLDFRLGLLRDNVSNLTDLWPDVDALLREMEGEQFRTEGARGGETWVALSPAYKLWKDRHYPGRPILVRKGRLKESLTQSGGSHTFVPGRMGMTFGSQVPYGIYHQTGTADMPPRPPINLLKKDDAVKVGKLMQEFIWKSGQGYQRVTI